jgi:hypothetical protein
MNAFEMITELMRKYGIGVRMECDNESNPRFYFENGFYKSDGCTFIVDDGTGRVMMYSRYGKECQVESIEDIGLESYQWYNGYRHYYDGWPKPAEGWVQLYQDMGLGKLVTKTFTEWKAT